MRFNSGLLNLRRLVINHEENFVSTTTKVPLGTRKRTGEACPESGIWKSGDSPSTTAPIAKGNTFPPHHGKAVYWILTQYA